MQGVLRKCTWFVAALLLPGDGDGLHLAFIDGEDAPQVVLTIVKGYISCRRCSLEWRVLRAVLAICCEDRKVDEILHRMGDTQRTEDATPRDQ